MDRKEELLKAINNPEELGTPCRVYTRVTGYIRDVSSFNAGKAAEYQDRLSYDYE